jgi:hypothetical protein
MNEAKRNVVLHDMRRVEQASRRRQFQAAIGSSRRGGYSGAQGNGRGGEWPVSALARSAYASLHVWGGDVPACAAAAQ